MIQKELRKTLTLVLAGGEGKRLRPLTTERAKPAVFFGGIYRIIDFALSNCINSGLRKIYLLTQYRSHSLQRHLTRGWHIHGPHEFLEVVPPQDRVEASGYRGTADAIYHNIFLINHEKPKYVLILAGDQVYSMNYGKFLKYHIEKDADLTIACVPSPRSTAKAFGCVKTDADGRIIEFIEKPEDPPGIPGREDHTFVSMGIYYFNTDELVNNTIEDSKNPDSSKDFGKDIIPKMLAEGKKLYAYSFEDEETGEESYWRDIGSIESYFEANMDLCQVEPLLDLYDKEWPILTYFESLPPSKTVFATEKGKDRRVGKALDSLISPGVIISGGLVVSSILSANVRINSYADVQRSVLFRGVDIGRKCKIKNTIIDKGVQVPSGTSIGYDLEEDKKQFTVSEGGIVIVPKGHQFK
jgi:glucose-1-phosphate adenylyltransferase